MALIGRTGGIAYTDPVVRVDPARGRGALLPQPGRAPDFTWARFIGFPLESPRAARVFPEFFHLFPAFGAYLFQSMGVKGALATPPVFGVLGHARACSSCCAACSAPRRRSWARCCWPRTSCRCGSRGTPCRSRCRSSSSSWRCSRSSHWEERGDAALGALAGFRAGPDAPGADRQRAAPGAGRALSARAPRAPRPALAAGCAAFLVPLLLLAVARGRPRRALLAQVPAERRQPPVLEPARLGVDRAARWRSGRCSCSSTAGARHAVRLLEAHGATLRRAVAGAARASPSPTRTSCGRSSPPGPAPTATIARATSSAGALFAALRALGFHRLAAHDAQALVRLGWFVTPLALVLALLGLLLVLREFRLRLPAADRGGARDAALFYLYKIRVYNDYFFALRRFVPVVLPFVLGLAALALVAPGRARRLAARGRGGARPSCSSARSCATRCRSSRYRDWDGAVRFVDDVARRFGPEDVLVFEQPKSIHLLSLPLWAVHGVTGAGAGALQARPRAAPAPRPAWRGRATATSTSSTPPAPTSAACSWSAWSRSRSAPSSGSAPTSAAARAASSASLHFTVSRVVPPEEIQVPPLPRGGRGRLRRRAGLGLLRQGGRRRPHLPLDGPLRVGLPARGATRGDARSCGPSTGQAPGDAARAGRRLASTACRSGAFDAGAGVDRARAAACPTRCRRARRVLRLDVPAWRPAHTDPAATDERDLGVMVDRLDDSRYHSRLVFTRRWRAVRGPGRRADVQRAGERGPARSARSSPWATDRRLRGRRRQPRRHRRGRARGHGASSPAAWSSSSAARRAAAAPP